MKQTEFENISARIRQRAVATARSMSVSDDEAEDIAQEAMLKLWTVRNDVSDAVHAEKLIVCIAKNKAIDSHRRLHTVPIDSSKAYIDEKLPTPENSLEDQENMAWLRERLEHLPTTEYQILRLRQVEQMTFNEIAQTLGISPTSVSTLLSRARNKILNEIIKRRETV